MLTRSTFCPIENSGKATMGAVPGHVAHCGQSQYCQLPSPPPPGFPLCASPSVRISKHGLACSEHTYLGVTGFLRRWESRLPRDLHWDNELHWTFVRFKWPKALGQSDHLLWEGLVSTSLTIMGSPRQGHLKSAKLSTQQQRHAHLPSWHWPWQCGESR